MICPIAFGAKMSNGVSDSPRRGCWFDWS